MDISLDVILAILGLGGYVFAGIFAFRGQWDKKTKEKQEEDRKLSDNLIQRLQQTVDQQVKDMDEMKRQMASQRDEIKHFQGRNAVLEELFKGRDPAMQNFLKDAPNLMDIARENNGLARENMQGLKKLEDTLAKFVNTLQPLLIHLEIAKNDTDGTDKVV